MSVSRMLRDKTGKVLLDKLLLEERGYTQFIGYKTGPMYWRRGDGQIYNKVNKYSIRCGYSSLKSYPHLEKCPNWVPPHQVCRIGIRGDHLHPLPTREELIDHLLRWKIKITQYNNPKWNREKVLQDVYEAWPFHLPYNPKYMAKQMKVTLNTVATNGADRTNKELLAYFGPDADDECEEIIAMLEDGDSEEYGSYWGPTKLESFSQRVPYEECPPDTQCCMVPLNAEPKTPRGVKQTGPKKKGLKKNRTVQSETESHQSGSKVEKYPKAATGKKLKGNTNHLVELKTTPRPNRGVSPLAAQGTPDQGEKFQGPKWMTPPESGQKKIHKKKTDSDEDDVVERFEDPTLESWCYVALPSGSNFDYSTTRHPKRTEETKPSGSEGRNEPKKKKHQSVSPKRTNMETKVGTASKKMEPAVKRQVKFASLKALEVPVQQVHPVAKSVFSRPESLKRATDGLQRNVSQPKDMSNRKIPKSSNVEREPTPIYVRQSPSEDPHLWPKVLMSRHLNDFLILQT